MLGIEFIEQNNKMKSQNSKQIITRFLAIMKQDILPLTKNSIELGNKIFGAAILAKKDLSLVVAGTNEETKNPLFHGEISCLNKYWSFSESERLKPQDCIFFSTHEPCSLCLSAITWSGFDNFYYFFSYEDSRDKFNIPHDLNILEQVFNCKNGAYQKNNSYWKSYHLQEMIKNFSEQEQQEWKADLKMLQKSYGIFSENYQSQKKQQNIPLD